MEEKGRDIAQLANEYNQMISNIQLPEMKVEDLLDLVDYYSRAGMDFESELYKRIAVQKFPDHPEVILMCAHWEADDGNWNGANQICSTMESNKYDEALFEMEKMLRMMLIKEANIKMNSTLNKILEQQDYDFLFDSAELFRDFGYMDSALFCLKQIPSDYVDFRQVLELKAECHFYIANYQEALEELDKAIDLNPFDDYLWAQTAMINYKMEEYDKALDACEYSLAISKNNPRAEHMKILLRWKKDGHYDMTAASYLRQDYSAMVEIGDLHYVQGDYKNAEMEYMAAGYFCPRGNRDRVQIVFKTACCRIMTGRYYDGIMTFLPALNQGFDLWPYAFELAHLLLKANQIQLACLAFSPVFKLDEVSIPRLELVIDLLTYFRCYKDMEEIWQYIIKREDKFSTVYKDLIAEAKRRLKG